MVSTLYPNEVIIGEELKGKAKDLVYKPKVDGRAFATGYDPSQVDISVNAMLAKPSEIQVIPRSEWSARIKEKEELKARVSDLLRRRNIPSTDQNGHGYCWAYSTVGCVIVNRAKNNQPYIRLNPHSTAAIIKNGRDEGGWCGLSAKFLMEHGVAPMEMWPEHSRSLSHDTPECRAMMKNFIVTEAFIDLSRAVYDQKMTFDQVATCLLLDIPCALDFNWWGHSVLGCDLVEVEPGDFCIRIRNSWTDGWGDKGFSVLRGEKTYPNGAVALATVRGFVNNSLTHAPPILAS